MGGTRQHQAGTGKLEERDPKGSLFFAHFGVDTGVLSVGGLMWCPDSEGLIFRHQIKFITHFLVVSTRAAGCFGRVLEGAGALEVRPCVAVCGPNAVRVGNYCQTVRQAVSGPCVACHGYMRGWVRTHKKGSPCGLPYAVSYLP